MKPLTGTRVVALEHAATAPYCTRILSGLGADVIKVERPPAGDFARYYDSTVGGQSAHFAWLNTGKRSIALDLKVAGGAEILLELIATADVLVSNLSPGTLERLTGVPRLRDMRPRLIECKISGYSQNGPYRDRRAYDLLIQGETAVTLSTGTVAHPAKAGISVADLAGGQSAALAILAALFARDRVGTGQTLEISLFDQLVDWMSPLLLTYKNSGATTPPAGTAHVLISPYGPFRCRDDVVLNIAVQNNGEWERFCRDVVRSKQLAVDPRYGTNIDRVQNRATLERRLRRIMAGQDANTMIERLDAAGIGWGYLNTVEEATEHPELVERGRWITARTPDGAVVDVLTDPIADLFASSSDDVVRDQMPSIGEHTTEILTELGYTKARLTEIRANGIIAPETDSA